MTEKQLSQRERLINEVMNTLNGETEKYSKKEVKGMIETVFTTLHEFIVTEERVAIKELGSFVKTNRSARKGRNPQTGEEIDIAARKGILFKPGKELKTNIQ